MWSREGQADGEGGGSGQAGHSDGRRISTALRHIAVVHRRAARLVIWTFVHDL